MMPAFPATTTVIPAPSRRRRRRRRMDPVLFIASTALGVLVLLSLLGWFTDIAGSTTATVGARFDRPSNVFWIGTDNLGRSLLPRLLEGIGTTLLLSLIAVACSAAVSTTLGMLAGYFAGGVSEVVMRVIDVLYAFPALVLAILVSALMGPGRTAAIVSITIITIPLMTRMIRIATMHIATRDFIVSARISGVSTPRIFITHLLPNIAGSIAVQSSYALSIAILVEGGLSFLGYGVQVPDASLGTLVQEGMQYMTQAPWLLLAPGVTLVISILCVNLVGDSLRDSFEPRRIRSLT
ncbi:MAG: ABC transporter permease [Microbacterium gubbeenense]|uniref:ABC transporter permease n=1 Tax=Microbacterium gubbeenense TaxID=159896 RepID=UPI003F98EFFA